jgi:Na+/H+-dicarboxylate symporter
VQQNVPKMGSTKAHKIGFILIMVAIVLGAIVGIQFPEFMLKLSWMGLLFLNLLKMIVLPLITSALISAVASMENIQKLGSIGGYMIAYIMTSACFAVMIGFSLVNVFKPGVGVTPHFMSFDSSKIAQKAFDFSDFIFSFFPPNIVEAAAKFEIMPVVIFSLVIGIACTACGKAAQPVVNFFVAFRTVLIKLITWVMYLTPLAMFSLLGTAMAEATLQKRLAQDIKSVFMFVLVLLLGLLFQILWQWVVVKVIAGVQAFSYMTKSLKTLMTAFGTSSSMATLPVALMCATEQGVREDVSRFVLPFATTINLSATVMYEAIAAIFLSQVMGMDLSMYDQIIIFFLAIVAGMGATGIPEGGLITMITVLKVLNIPTSAIALLLPFDRILDRLRTVTNVWGDLACATTVNYFVNKREKKLKKAKGDTENNLSPIPK